MPEPVLNDRERVLADDSRCQPRTERSTSARGTSPRSLLTSGKSGKRRLSLVVTGENSRAFQMTTRLRGNDIFTESLHGLWRPGEDVGLLACWRWLSVELQ